MTFTPSAARSNHADTAVAPTTAMSTAGIFVVNRGRTSRTASTRGAEHQRGGVGRVEVGDELADLVDEPVGIGREAEQLRELTDDDGDAQPVHVADLDLLREQSGDEAELAEAETDLDQPDHHSEHSGEHDRRAGIVTGEHQRGDRGEDQRRDRRVRSQHQHAGRPEHCVADEAGDRRVQTGDRGSPASSAYAMPCGTRIAASTSAGDQIGTQPRRLVVPQQPQPRAPIAEDGASSVCVLNDDSFEPSGRCRRRAVAMRRCAGSCSRTRRRRCVRRRWHGP